MSGDGMVWVCVVLLVLLDFIATWRVRLLVARVAELERERDVRESGVCVSLDRLYGAIVQRDQIIKDAFASATGSTSARRGRHEQREAQPRARPPHCRAKEVALSLTSHRRGCDRVFWRCHKPLPARRYAHWFQWVARLAEKRPHAFDPADELHAYLAHFRLDVPRKLARTLRRIERRIRRRREAGTPS